LRDGFQVIDPENRGHVTREAFCQALKKMNDAGNAENIYRAIDRRNAGLISLRNFLLAFESRSGGGDDATTVSMGSNDSRNTRTSNNALACAPNSAIPVYSQ
jgi:Ca2+-binding EF-hand superfamily protein